MAFPFIQNLCFVTGFLVYLKRQPGPYALGGQPTPFDVDQYLPGPQGHRRLEEPVEEGGCVLPDWYYLSPPQVSVENYRACAKAEEVLLLRRFSIAEHCQDLSNALHLGKGFPVDLPAEPIFGLRYRPPPFPSRCKSRTLHRSPQSVHIERIREIDQLNRRRCWLRDRQRTWAQ